MEKRKNFFRMFGFVRPYAFLYALGLLSYNMQAFMFQMIGGISFGGFTRGILSGDFSIVINYLIFAVVAIVATSIILGAGIYIYVVLRIKADGDFKLRIFSSYMKSSLEGEKHSGEGIAAINTDADTAKLVYGAAISWVLGPALTILMSSTAVLIMDWRMGIGLLIVCLISFLSQAGFSGPLAKIGKERLETNAETVKSMSNIFAGALTIRAFSRQDRALVQFDKESGKLKKLELKNTFIDTFRNMLTTLQGWLVLVLIFGFGSFLVAVHDLDFAVLMVIFTLAGGVGGAASSIGAAYAGLMPPP